MAAFSALLGVLAGPAAAGTIPFGDQFSVSGQSVLPGGYAMAAPAVAYDSERNRYLVAWVDSASLDVRARLVNADGSFASAAFPVSNANVATPATGLSIAYDDENVSPLDDQYLVVWNGDPGLAGEHEVYGQRISATGVEVGTNDFRISNMGPDGNAAFDAGAPDVGFSKVDNQFLVAWSGDDAVDGENEIWAERLTGAATPPPGGVTDDFKLSDMGPDGDAAYDALTPAVAASNSQTNAHWMVAWAGDDNSGNHVDDEFEIWGQAVNNDGGEIGGDFEISADAINATDDDETAPDLTWNPITGQYFAVWQRQDASTDVLGRLVGVTGTTVGIATRLSRDGLPPVQSYDSADPSVTFNAATGRYLAVWTSSPVPGGSEIFGQDVNANGSESGGDFQISVPTTGVTGANSPAVAAGGSDKRSLTVWRDSPSGLEPEPEIFGRGLTEDGDADGVGDADDNCPSMANADQANNDGDATGDACDADDDNDGVQDSSDNCRFTTNGDQANNDGDPTGDACDADDDNDGVQDSSDNCALAANADQADNDRDGGGDICDADDDNDTVADGPDNCRFSGNRDQADNDKDGAGDVCDADDDDDGVADTADKCPRVKPTRLDVRPRDGCDDSFPRASLGDPLPDPHRIFETTTLRVVGVNVPKITIKGRAGARVNVKVGCKGCTYRTSFTLRAKKGVVKRRKATLWEFVGIAKARIAKGRKKGDMPATGTFTITITKPDHIGARYTIKLRKGRIADTAESCLDPALAPGACP